MNAHCAAWLNKTLAPIREHPTKIEDTFDFVSRLSITNLNSSHIASFDAIGLLTNIPLGLAINLALQKIYSDSKVALFHGLNKTQFTKLLIWTTKNTILKLNDQYCKQVKKVAIKSLLISFLADLCMNGIVDQIKNKSRYIDDWFALFSNQDGIMSICNLLTKLLRITK